MIRILFQGDSITDAGRNRLSRHSLAGYAKKTAEILNARHPGKFDFYNRGISGNLSINLLERYKRHFVKMKPNLVTVMIGINDVWRKYDRHSTTSPEKYAENLTTLFTNIKKDTGAKIIVLSPYLTHGTDGKWSIMRKDVDTFIKVCKEVSEKYAELYIDTNKPMTEADVVFPHEQISKDGIHPQEKGQEILAGLLADGIESLYLDL